MEQAHSEGRHPAAPLRALVSRVARHLSVYDLFAITVVYMVFGHFAENFFDDARWLRVGDRILVPVFLIPIGYNTGRKVDWKLAGGAAVTAFMRWFMFARWLKPLPAGAMPILVTIVATRLVLHRLMDFALKSRLRFWGLNLVLAALAPWTHAHVCEYGTLGVILAMAGWLSRARAEAPKEVVEPGEYFLLVFFFYIAFNQSMYGFTPLQLACTVAGAGLVFCLLYDFRDLLVNSLKRRPRDAVSRICRFTGSNSLEIYTLHMIVYYGVYYYALSVPAGP